MKRIMRKNQVIITVLAVMIAIAGYLTYAGRVDIAGRGTDSSSQNTSDAKEAIAEYDTYIAGSVQSTSNDTASNNGTNDSNNTADNVAGNVTSDIETNTANAAQNTNTAQNTDQNLTANTDNSSLDDTALTDIDSLDQDIDDPGKTVLANGLTVSDYMAQTKLAREQSRGKNKEDLLAIIDSDAQTELDKQAAIDAVVRLTDYSDKENAVETLLSAKGFENSIVSITQDAVDVVICKDNLTDAELAQIEDIVKRKASVSASQICITLMGSAKAGNE